MEVRLLTALYVVFTLNSTLANYTNGIKEIHCLSMIVHVCI